MAEADGPSLLISARPDGFADYGFYGVELLSRQAHGAQDAHDQVGFAEDVAVDVVWELTSESCFSGGRRLARCRGVVLRRW